MDGVIWIEGIGTVDLRQCELRFLWPWWCDVRLARTLTNPLINHPPGRFVTTEGLHWSSISLSQPTTWLSWVHCCNLNGVFIETTVPICREQTVVAALLDSTSKQAQSYTLHFWKYQTYALSIYVQRQWTSSDMLVWSNRHWVPSQKHSDGRDFEILKVIFTLGILRKVL